LSESSGRAALEAIGARVANGTPRPGSEAALRHLVAGVLHGTPDYDRLGQDLATAMQCQLSHVESHLRDLGNPVNTRFVEVDKLGWDIYEITHFRHAKTRWHVNLANDGRIVGVLFVDIGNGDSSPCKSGSGCMADFHTLNPK
jgi:hypothetical protein